MGRRTVWVSEELEELVGERLEDVNWSAALAAGIRSLLDCDHAELQCAACGTSTTRDAIVGPALERFYSKVMWELGLKVAAPGYEGAAKITRRVALDHGVPGLAGVPVPRATRANHEHRADDAHEATVAALPREADSRRRHPTARPVTHEHPGPLAPEPQEQTA